MRLARAVVAGLLVAVTLGPGAGAQEAGGHVSLSFVGQAPWVGPDGDFALRVKVEGEPELELAVTVYPRLGSRSAFESTLEERPRLQNAVSLITAPLGALQADADGVTTVPVPVERIGLFRAGVYPVRAVVRERGGDAIDGFTTHLTFVADPVADATFRLGLVLPIHAAPALATDGSTWHLPDEDLNRIKAVTAALAAHPDVNVSVAPTPETIDALDATEPAALDTLAGAVRGRPVIASTYVPTSVPALLQARLEDETTAQLTVGAERLRAAWGADPDTRTWVAFESLNEDSLARLREQRIERVVVGSESLTETAAPLSGAGLRPFALEAGGSRRLPALVADADLGARLDDDVPPALGAQRFLSELAVMATTTAARRDGDVGVVALVPRTWKGAGAGVPALLDGLDSHPLVGLHRLDDLFELPADTTRSGTPAVRRLAEVDPPSVSGAAVRGARSRLSSFTTVVPDGLPRIDELDRALLVAQSADLRSSSRARWINGVHRGISDVVGRVRIPSRGGAVTVTARRGDVPISIQNEAPFPLRAIVELDSDSLDFPQGTTREVQLDRLNTSARFVVRARSSGTFPMRVRLMSPDGRLELASSRLVVRSTAFSGVGVLISAGAALFLVVWWGRHLRRGRRARRLVPVDE